VNTSDLPDPMIMAIITSQRKKRANAQNFRKWRLGLLLTQLLRQISPIIPASNGIVFGSQGVIIICLSCEVSRF